MFTALSRILKYGFQGFWRNGWLSMATISILIITLIVFEGLIIFRILTQTALRTLQNKIDISIYFKMDVAEDDILKTQKALESLPEVKSVEYISRDLALTTFKAKHKADSAITQSLEELQTNPLLASLNIKANNTKDYAGIASRLDNWSSKDLFDKVTYAQNAVVIERLSKIIDTAERGGFVLTIFLTLVAVLVTFNTIRLAIYSSRDEIGIMRLVGASNYLIRGPYMVEGIIYGFISAVLSLLLAAPAIYFISPYIKIFIPEMNLWFYFSSNLLMLFAYQLLFGIGLGVVSSYIAVRKYLRI